MQVILNKQTPTQPGRREGVRSVAFTPKTKPSGAKTNLARQRKTTSIETPIFALLIIAALIWGWLNRGEYLTAESGIGYYLGIAGATAMLALLLYPLRKHVPWMRGTGSVAFWFRLHMALGLIGPTLILYHANFGLGSANSNVALWSMLIVAGSGLAGRFFYAKIHRGLYGKRAEARELMSEATQFRAALNSDMGNKMLARIDALEHKSFESADGVFGAAVKAIVSAGEARRLRKTLHRRIKSAIKLAKEKRKSGAVKELRAHLVLCNRYFQRIEQTAELSFYERLFSAWHVLHLPLFFLLIFTAVIHVVAVHLY